MNKRAAGSGYEMLAVQYLEGQGFQIFERNFRSSSAEIDIVAQEGKYLVFTEVKQRSTGRRGRKNNINNPSVSLQRNRRACKQRRAAKPQRAAFITDW